jgi:hypothetical protein
MKKNKIYYPYKPWIGWKIITILAIILLTAIYLLLNQHCKTDKNKNNKPLEPILKISETVKMEKDLSEIIVLDDTNRGPSANDLQNVQVEESPGLERKNGGIFYTDKKQNRLYYRIYPGNTFYQLSKAFNIPIKDFQKYTGTRQLNAYQWIVIPFSDIGPFEIYRVKKGDTLIGIARQFKASIGSIVVINHIWQPANLKAGSYILVISNRKEI